MALEVEASVAAVSVAVQPVAVVHQVVGKRSTFCNAEK